MMRIVLPTDFSKNADNAINYALQLFKDTECIFYVLHTYTPAIYRAEYVLHSPGQMGLGDIYQTSSMTKLEQVTKKLKNQYKNKNHTFIEHTTFNILVDEINEVVEKEKIDLIVMGTQGATGAKEIFLGTHTMHVIKKAKCPVLAIPPNFEYEIPKEILFPTDFEINYEKKHLKVLLDMVKTHISRMHIMYVRTGYDLSEQQQENRNTLTGFLEHTAHLVHEMPDQEVISAINSFQVENKTNLLVMVQNKHMFLENLFLKSVIKQIGFHVNIPFMVFPPLLKVRL